MWLIPLLLKYALPFVLTELQKLGLISETEAIAVKLGLRVKVAVDGIKTYHAPEDFPSQKPNNPFGMSANGQTNKGTISLAAENTNINKG